MPEGFVLDAFAVLAFLQNEPAAPIVAPILSDLSSTLHMSAVNLGEVLYISGRRSGLATAMQIESELFSQPNLRIEPASWERIRAAAQIKAAGGMSYADTFAAQLAMELGLPLVTGDREFAPLERAGRLQVFWLPQRS